MQCFKKHFAFSTVSSENSCFKTTVRKACFLLCTATSCGFDSRYFQMWRMYCRQKSRPAVQMRFFLLPTATAAVANSKNKKCTVSTWCIEKRLWINESVSSQPRAARRTCVPSHEQLCNPPEAHSRALDPHDWSLWWRMKQKLTILLGDLYF